MPTWREFEGIVHVLIIDHMYKQGPIRGGVWVSPSPGGVLPYMGHIGMCSPKGYGFSAVLVINKVLILADFGHFGHN